MTVRAQKFTPEVLLSAPRRGKGTPNAVGDKVIYSVTEYSFTYHKQYSEIRMFLSKTGETVLVTDKTGAASPTWVGEELLLLLPGPNPGSTEIVVGDPSDFEKS